MSQYPSHVTTPGEQRLYDDFRAFLWYLWRHLGLPAPTFIQLSIALFLQHGPRRRIIEAFRGVGKSWITAAYVLWRLYRDPQIKIMVVSASKERADAFSIFVKRLIAEVDILKFLEPRDGQRDSNIAFDVGPATPDQSPSVKSVGITGQMAGSRADLIVPDDVEIPKNSATEQQREKLSELVKEFDAVLKPNGEIVILGTPQTAQSIYNTLETRGYVARIWPARFSPPETYAGRLAPELEAALEADPSLLGTTTEPARFTDLDLAEREASYGRSGFALQFMLDTTLNDENRYPLKLRDLIVMALDKEIAPVKVAWASGPEQRIEGLQNVGLNGDRYHRPMYVSKDFASYQAAVMFVDPSGRGKDETSFGVLKALNGILYLRRWGGLQGGYDESTLKALAEIARDEKVNEVWVEGNFGDGMFLTLFGPVLAKIHPCALEEYKVTGQKEARIIDKLEPVLNQHRLVVDQSLIEKDDVGNLKFSGFYQLTHLTKDRGSLRHDDRVDVLAEAVGHFTSMMSADLEKSEERHKERLRDEALRKFMALCRKQGGGRRNRSYLKSMT